MGYSVRFLSAFSVVILLMLVFLRVNVPSSPLNGQSLLVHDTDRDLGILAVGKHMIYFKIANSSSAPLRVFGLSASCGNGVCFGPADYDHVIIPANGVINYYCEIIICKSGPFEKDISIYLEDGGLRNVKLRVKGLVAEGSPHAIPRP
jgi:hypothetical protein